LNRRQRSQQRIRNPDCFALSKRDQHTSWSLDFRLSLLPPVNNRFALQSTKEAGGKMRTKRQLGYLKRAPAILLSAILLMPAVVLNALPIITSQPADQMANQDYSAAFQVQVTYTPPLTFQWYFNSGALLSAITNE